ncbi:RDD family protein [Bacillus suaedaesalsae]|uniref:RDD family protein n=1 Tax=Bacillus suaedaesalsae TaxID=2810349 RepID=A0ABS2DG52_9BACI|nr:RDD family protein [Bacillus suaedaesalsae]MBM6617453.1 RDD family protein [Bacillus suaedaesalsae]
MVTPIYTNEVNETEKTDQFNPIEKRLFYAGFWMRLWAYLLDLLVVASINQILIYPIFKLFDFPLEKTSMFAPIAILTALTMYIYFVLLTKFFKQTLGKMLFGLKVVDLKGHDTLSWSTVIFREVVGKFISKTIFFIGFLVVAFSTKNQGIHDMFADTSVVLERFSDN